VRCHGSPDKTHSDNVARRQAALLYLRCLCTRACCNASLPLQIARRRRAHQDAHPDAKIISLGIGDTTEPLPKYIADAMAKAAAGLATREGYSG
jgi:hypothetical protein